MALANFASYTVLPSTIPPLPKNSARQSHNAPSYGLDKHSKLRTEKREWNIAGIDDVRTAVWNLADELDPQSNNCRTLKEIHQTLDAAHHENNSPEALLPAAALIGELLNELSIEYLATSPTRSKSHHEESDHCLADLRALLLKADHTLRTSCQELQLLINQKFPCNAPRVIHSVPAYIQVPGTYCITQDLVNTTARPAITILANNVILNCGPHTIELTDPSSQGIAVLNVKNVKINSATIFTSAPSNSPDSIGIYVANSIDTLFKNCSITGTFMGVKCSACIGLAISDSELTDIGNSALFVLSIESLSIQDTIITNATTNSDQTNIFFIDYYGLAMQRCTITNAPITARRSDALLGPVSCLTLTDVNITITDPACSRPALQLGSLTTLGIGAVSTNITNCSCTNAGMAPALTAASGSMLQCTDSIFTTGIQSAAITFGSAFDNWSRAHFTNCTVTATSTSDAVLTTNNATQIHFNKCLVTGNVNLMDGKNSFWQNCNVNGRVLFNGANSICVFDSSVINNPTSNVPAVFFDSPSLKSGVINSTIYGTVKDNGRDNVLKGNIIL